MKIQALVLLVLAFCLVRADEYAPQEDGEPQEEGESYSEEAISPQTQNVEKANDAPKEPKEPKEPNLIAVKEDVQTETSLAEDDEIAQKRKNGFCQWSQHQWHNSGSSVRCSCMKCTCRRGVWGCVYFFPYCPYYYCGGQIYNPRTQLCCCGKIYTKRAAFNCCGYFYYNARTSKCCNYFTVKPRRANCPRFQIKG